MKHASTTKEVRAAASGGRLARLVQTGVAVFAVAVLWCGPAHAQRHGDQADPRAQDPRVQQQDPRMQQRQEQRDPRFDPRSFDGREADERRQQDQGMRQEARRSSGRLTPDERRDLRRQINEAGMDLYPHPSRR
jgi:hypothetical protein